jgi:hypothetical protein
MHMSRHDIADYCVTIDDRGMTARAIGDCFRVAYRRAIDELRQVRKRRAELAPIMANYYGITVYRDPEEPLYKALSRVKSSVFRARKVPRMQDSHRYIGVEIECFVDDREEFEQDLLAQNLHPFVQVGSDGSLRHEDTDLSPVEVRVMATEDAIRSVLQKVCQSITLSGGKVNRTCGLHVHLDCRPPTGRRKATAYSRLVRALPWLLALVAPSRIGNQYCATNTSRLMRNQEDRYYAINGRPPATVEVRLHQGSIDPNKIYYWIEIVRSIADTRVRGDIPRTLAAAREVWAWSDEVTTYVDARVRQFGRALAMGLFLPQEPLAQSLQRALKAARVLEGE